MQIKTLKRVISLVLVVYNFYFERKATEANMWTVNFLYERASHITGSGDRMTQSNTVNCIKNYAEGPNTLICICCVFSLELIPQVIRVLHWLNVFTTDFFFLYIFHLIHLILKF